MRLAGSGGLAISTEAKWQWKIHISPALADWSFTYIRPAIMRSAAGLLGAALNMTGAGFRGVDQSSTDNIRNSPGTALGGENLPLGDANWLSTGMGYFPKQVADLLPGQQFDSFRKFREAFWRTVSNTPVLRNTFSPENQALIADGFALLLGKLIQ